MSPEEARDLLRRAEEAAGSTAIEECLSLLAQLQEGSDGSSALSSSERGQALALEVYAKDLIAAEEGFCARYLEQVLEQVKPGTAFREGLARTLGRLGRTREALDLTEELALRVPGDWQVHADLAELRLAALDPTGARKALDRARELVPLAAASGLQIRARDMDPECLLGLALARPVSDANPEDGPAAFLAGWQELALHQQPDLAVMFFQRAHGAGYQAEGLAALRPVALALSGQPCHGTRALEQVVRELAESGETASASVGQAALAYRQGEAENCFRHLSSSLDVILSRPDRTAVEAGLEWFLLSARLLCLPEGESNSDGLHLLESLVLRILAHGTVTAPVLAVWRLIQSSQRQPQDVGEMDADSLSVVRLILEGDCHRHASDFPQQNQGTGEVLVPFAVAYEVATPAGANTEKWAADLAIDLESRLGAGAMEAQIIGIRNYPAGVLRPPLGVMRRSGRVFHQGEETRNG